MSRRIPGQEKIPTILPFRQTNSGRFLAIFVLQRNFGKLKLTYLATVLRATVVILDKQLQKLYPAIGDICQQRNRITPVEAGIDWYHRHESPSIMLHIPELLKSPSPALPAD